MTGKVFVDTNVLVYAHDSTAGEKHLRAQEILFELWGSGLGCLSVQVLQEFYVTVTQKVSSPMGFGPASDIIKDLSLWHIHAPGSEDVLRAIEIQAAYKLSFWDSMIINSAVQLGCEKIWSEDLNAGQGYAGLLLLNPFTT